MTSTPILFTGGDICPFFLGEEETVTSMKGTGFTLVLQKLTPFFAVEARNHNAKINNILKINIPYIYIYDISHYHS